MNFLHRFSSIAGLVFLMLIGSAKAQKIDVLSLENTSWNKNAVFFHYQNDLFAKQDRNYTQGYQLNLALKAFNKWTSNFLFPSFKSGSLNVSGIALEHASFTPQNLASIQIQSGDRPYASHLTLQLYNKCRISELLSSYSSYAIGVIGPAALGEETQVYIHERVESVIPEGWHNQIQNDLVLSWKYGIDLRMFRLRNSVEMRTLSQIQVGTLYNYASLGTFLKTGFLKGKDEDKFEFYAFLQPQAKLVLYDATLQGGVFNKNSPYVLDKVMLNRLNYFVKTGLCMNFNKFQVLLEYALQSPEFDSGTQAKWGGIRLFYTWD